METFKHLLAPAPLEDEADRLPHAAAKLENMPPPPELDGVVLFPLEDTEVSFDFADTELKLLDGIFSIDFSDFTLAFKGSLILVFGFSVCS